MASVETEIALLKQQQNNMESKLDAIGEKFDDFVNGADDRYVMRKEFILAISIVGTICGIVMPIVVFLLSKLRG